jgi:hypothetical protein
MSDPGLLSDAGAARAKALARRYLDDGSFGDEQVRRSAAIAAPLLVAGPRREPHSWLVGLTQGDRLVGLFQFLLDGTVMRYSTFQRRPGDLTHSPPARDWLDGRERARRGQSARWGDDRGRLAHLRSQPRSDRLGGEPARIEWRDADAVRRGRLGL